MKAKHTLCVSSAIIYSKSELFLDFLQKTNRTAFISPADECSSDLPISSATPGMTLCHYYNQTATQHPTQKSFLRRNAHVAQLRCKYNVYQILKYLSCKLIGTIYYHSIKYFVIVLKFKWGCTSFHLIITYGPSHFPTDWWSFHFHLLNFLFSEAINPSTLI